MKPKVIFSIFLITLIAGFLFLNQSYEKSIKAKYYYEIGEYEVAYSLAQEAFNVDVYNRMASTIMAQSKTSLKYVSYINDAKKYMLNIDEIAKHEIISEADRAKIKIICKIMLSSYIKLAPSVITDEELVQEATKYHHGFEKLLEKVIRN